MTTQEKKQRIEELKKKANELKREADYYNALQLALKLVLNGSYGSFCSQYFVLFNEYVGGTITAQGRELTQKMDTDNVHYWKNVWHEDKELHDRLGIRNVRKIGKDVNVSIYADTDSIFVSFEPAINTCDWKNQIFPSLPQENRPHIILSKGDIGTTGGNMTGMFTDPIEFIKAASENPDLVLYADGSFVKDRDLRNTIRETGMDESRIIWDWDCELDFIQGLDFYRYEGYFRECLEKHAQNYGVENKQDFELERISESIINIAKKKYIQHIVFEDGINHDRMTYLFPKGVELIRSSTPLFAREKIVDIVKYLFAHPDDFNIKDLLLLVKGLRKEFELADMDSISMQSSVNKYEEKVEDDKQKLSFKTGTHFAVKAGAYYNHLLHQNKELQEKYEFIKSGDKIKYYYCNSKNGVKVFAFKRGYYPMEFAPDPDYDTQFAKCILSPVNSILQPLGLPEVTKRLTVVMDIFGMAFDEEEDDEEDDTDWSEEDPGQNDFWDGI